MDFRAASTVWHVGTHFDPFDKLDYKIVAYVVANNASRRTFKLCKIICCSICGSRLLIYGNTLLWRGVSLEKYFISTPSLPAALPCLQQLNNEAKYLSMSAGPSYDLREGDYAYKHQFSLEKNRFPPLKKCNPLIKQHKFPSKGITCSLWKLSLYLLPWLANL